MKTKNKLYLYQNNTLLCIIILICLQYISCQKQEIEEIKIIGSPNQVGYLLDLKMIKQFEKENPKIKVQFLRGPESTTERLAYYLDILKNNSDEIDVFYVDVIWPVKLSPYMVDLSEPFKDEIKDHLAITIKNNTINGKLIGIPFFIDIGVLFYRTDLFKKYNISLPPKTWDELEKQAKYVQKKERKKGNNNFWGYVWQGAPYEGLTCNAIEWQISHDGGQILSKKGNVEIYNSRSIKAFNRASNWIGTISPPAIIGFQEEDCRSVWQQGNALFMRNWPYAYAKGQAKKSYVRNKVGITFIPTDRKKHASALGGWMLSISNYSQNKEAAIKLIKFLTSKQIQKQRAIMGSYMPTRSAIYYDLDVIKANPFFANIRKHIDKTVIARPSSIAGKKYDAISYMYFSTVHKILLKKDNPRTLLRKLEIDIQNILSQKTQD